MWPLSFRKICRCNSHQLLILLMFLLQDNFQSTRKICFLIWEIKMWNELEICRIYIVDMYLECCQSWSEGDQVPLLPWIWPVLAFYPFSHFYLLYLLPALEWSHFKKFFQVFVCFFFSFVFPFWSKFGAPTACACDCVNSSCDDNTPCLHLPLNSREGGIRWKHPKKGIRWKHPKKRHQMYCIKKRYQMKPSKKRHQMFCIEKEDNERECFFLGGKKSHKC